MGMMAKESERREIMEKGKKLSLGLPCVNPSLSLTLL